jgi:beta-1,4-mannooligosaccharide phosphorylase
MKESVMRWIKRGLVYNSTGSPSWMTSHAMIPTADHLHGDVYRIYFAPRDECNRSNVAFVDIDLKFPQEILRVSEKPILTYGELGGFDDSGALASWIVNYQGLKYLFYIAYNIGVTVIFRNFIGLAISRDDGASFQKVSRAGIIDRTEVDPLLAVTPCVLLESGVWRMWYTTGTKWVMENDKPKHYYHIKYAESSDGVHWDRRRGHVCIDFKSPEEYAIARPSVVKDGALYRMWFCCRGQRYRLGYAESKDGLTWERNDDRAGMTVSESGWDSEMVCYPFVFSHNGQIYMLYNGNGYGQTGFGLAVLER